MHKPSIMNKYIEYIKGCFLLLYLFGMGVGSLQAQGVLHISNGASIHSTAGSTMTLHNTKLSNQGTVQLYESTLHFTGTTPKAMQTLEGTGYTMLGYMKVNKPTEDVQLHKSISVSRVLSLTSGGIELVSGNIELGNSGELQNETATSRIYGTGGEIKSAQALGIPNALNPANLGAILTSSISLGNTQIYRGHQSMTVNGQNSALRYFKIAPANNMNLNATLRFQYFDQELNGVNESDMQLWYSLDNGNTWIQTKAIQRDATNNWIETSQLKSMAWFTIAPPCTPFQTPIVQYISVDQSYFFKGLNRTTTGIYVDSLLTGIGCDSIVTLDLKVKPISTLSPQDTIVRGIGYFTLNGKVYTSNQLVRDTLRGAQTDSIRVYNVIINNPKIIPVTIVECQNFYTWRGKRYTQNGIFRDTVIQKYTDTVYEVNLILQNMNLGVSYINGEFVSNCTICNNFQWYLCNADGTKTKIINATNRTFKTITDGDYMVEVEGVAGCKGNSPCVNKISASVIANFGVKIIAYPNPVKEKVNVVLEKVYRNLSAIIYDKTGRIVYQSNFENTQEFSIDMNHLSVGTYFLKLMDSENSISDIQLIKE